MGKLYGITATDIVPQSDFAAKQNENGGWAATQSFVIRKGGVDAVTIRNQFVSGKYLTELDPNADQYFAFLRLASIGSIETIEGGWTKIKVEFVGLYVTYNAPDEEAQAPTYSKRGMLIEKPFSEHPKWAACSTYGKNILAKMLNGNGELLSDGTVEYMSNVNGRQVSDPLTGDSLEFATRISEGKTTYPLGTYEYTHRWESSTGITAAQMNKLGRIATPSGSPPTPGTGRNWLLTGVNEEQYGSGDFRFQNELTYLLSDEGGHDSFLLT